MLNTINRNILCVQETAKPALVKHAGLCGDVSEFPFSLSVSVLSLFLDLPDDVERKLTNIRVSPSAGFAVSYIVEFIDVSWLFNETVISLCSCFDSPFQCSVLHPFLSAALPSLDAATTTAKGNVTCHRRCRPDSRRPDSRRHLLLLNTAPPLTPKHSHTYLQHPNAAFQCLYFLLLTT